VGTYFAWKNPFHGSWIVAFVFGGIAVFLLLLPRLIKSAETVQVDDVGVTRIEGDIHEQIAWDEVAEIRIITTAAGPWAEDVFFALGRVNGTGCLVSHEAAERTKLFQALQSRFPDLDDDMVKKAMGCTSNDQFMIWKRPDKG
jgi:hypothetical protein